ncbi:MAG TPA: MmcQ/YjbR family DNA-binding protein [Candidatus Acidoferrales bacterium]|nr:MmcQ/YjbR family DNA-binding protein [Candidatus Acidoferrales bacterium]
MAKWADVKRIARTLPGTTEDHSSSGKMSWIVSRKVYAWERPLRKSDIAALGKRAPKGPVLGLKTADLEMKDVLLASDPKVFFTTPHFDGYPSVLVELDRISVRALREALVEAWFACAGKRLAASFLAGLSPPAKSRGKAARGRTRA